MRTLGTLLLLAGFLHFNPEIATAADEPAAIIDKAIKAAGGVEKLNKIKAEKWTTKGAMEVMGMKMNYTGDYYFQPPALLRFDIEADVGGQKFKFSAATDGKVFWQRMGDMIEEMDKKKAAAFRHTVYTMSLSQLTPLTGKGFTFAAVDEIMVEGKPAVGVKVDSADHASVTLYFDKKTGLLVKSSTMIWDEFTVQDVKQEVFFLNYKEVDGRANYEKLVIHRDGKHLLTEEIVSHKSVEKHDPQLFAKPK